MMREGSLPGTLEQPATTSRSGGLRRWSGPALQSLVLVVLLGAMALTY